MESRAADGCLLGDVGTCGALAEGAGQGVGGLAWKGELQEPALEDCEEAHLTVMALSVRWVNPVPSL